MPQFRIGDATIFYEELGAGEPLLIMHGMLETSQHHARLALALSRKYRVILPDLRGYGRSTPRPRPFPTDFYRRDADDMAALLRHLKLSAARIVGVADGGESALLMAITAPEQVRSLVAVSVAGVLPSSLLERLPNMGAWATEETMTKNLAWRSEVLREYGVEGTRAIWDGWKRAAREIINAGGNISLRQAGQIKCPVLIVNGADDNLNTPDLSRTLAAAIPKAELDLIPDVDQQVYDKQHRWFTDRVLAWFAAH